MRTESLHTRQVVSAAIIVLSALAVGCASRDRQIVTVPPVAGPEQVAPSPEDVIPVGQPLDVRLQSRLSSETAKPEDRFQATTLVDLMQGRDVLVPAGSIVGGVISSVDDADRIDRKGRLTLTFDRLFVRGRRYDIRARAVEAFESEGIRGEIPQIATGAGAGAILGGLLGGFKGALAGILIGGGGVVAATEGEDVVLPAGTIVRIEFDSPITVR